MPVPNLSHYQDNTILITPTKQRFPVNEAEKPYVVTTNSYLMRKILSGLAALIFLSGGIYLILVSRKDSHQKAVLDPTVNTKPEPAASISGFVRMDPDKVGLPAGWERVKTKSGRLDIGFNPQTQTFTALENKIVVKDKQCCSELSLELFPYQGSGRHEFILRKMKVIDLTGLGSDASTHEQIYDIGERRALLIYGVDYNGKTIIGMLQADESNAYLILGTGLTQAEMEAFLYTIRVF